jgi:hypothetical protein
MVTDELPNPIVAACVGWMVRGASDDMIRGALAEKAPELNADAVMLAAAERLKGHGVLDSTYTRGWAASAYRSLINKMLEIGDLDGARKAVDNVVKLAAQQPASQTEPSDMDRILAWGYIHGEAITDAER